MGSLVLMMASLSTNGERIMKRSRYIGYADLNLPVETPDRIPVQSNELQVMIDMAAARGFTVDTASEIRSRYEPVLIVYSELYAAWYALKHNITVYVDNFSELIKFTGWQRAMLKVA